MSEEKMLTPVKREIINYPNPILSTVCDPVREDEFNSDLEQLCLDMFYTMKTDNGIGLAANQIGVCKRIIVMAAPNNVILINPVILEASGEISLEEGCLSIPKYFAKVKRSENVRVGYQDVSGEHYMITTSGLQAVCLQHEIDHLDGKVFLDRLSVLKRMRAKAKALKFNKP